MKRVSVTAAIALGTLWVNIPVIPLMFTPIALFVFLSAGKANQQPVASDLLPSLGLFVLGFVLAWSWWSIMVPRWRLWAWSHVEALVELKRRAVRAGLIWPDGHLFEKTEFRTKATQARLRELESQMRPHA